MQIVRPILMLALFSCSLLCHGEENCLWLNAATAGGILGGPVSLSVSHPNPLPAGMQPANATSSYGPTSASPGGATYASSQVDDADCAFDRQPPKVGGIHISVRTLSDPEKTFAMYTAQCGSRGVPLKAVGNEAMACEVKKKGRRLSEQVAGRIRDRLFVMNISIENPSLTRDELFEKARDAAEIVAGNLF